MGTRGVCRSIVGLLGLALVLGVTVAADAQGPAVTIGTNPPGSVFYAVGSGLGKVVTEAGKVRLSVQPHTGSSTFIPLINARRDGVRRHQRRGHGAGLPGAELPGRRAQSLPARGRTCGWPCGARRS